MPDAATPATIFVVDDDQGLLRLMERTLQREGFTTTTAGSGSSAIDWLARHSADLMLVDLKLQDIEGRELINHLAALGRSIPFIILMAALTPFTRTVVGTSIGTSAAIQRLRNDVVCAARSDVKVLITGERGLGKESVCRRAEEVA